MNSKRSLVVIFAVLMAVLLPACTLSASTPPPTAETTEGSFPVPGTDTMDIFQALATQTAIAAAGGTVPTQPAAVATTAGGEPQPTQAGAASPQAPAPTQPPAANPTQPAVQPTAVPTAITVPSPTPGIPASYTLQKGEYPFCLARRFNVNPSELLALNGLGVNTVLQPGMKINIPQTGSPFPGDRVLIDHPGTYTVTSNDTIYSIACKYGEVDPLAIAAANGMSAPYSLTAGQIINIP